MQVLVGGGRVQVLVGGGRVQVLVGEGECRCWLGRGEGGHDHAMLPHRGGGGGMAGRHQTFAEERQHLLSVYSQALFLATTEFSELFRERVRG